MKNKKNDIKSTLIGLIVGLVTFILVFGGYYVYTNFIKNDTDTDNKLEQIKKEEQEKIKEKEEIPYVNELPNYRSQYNNDYIMGRLEIPNMNINALATRASNNDYYLNYNIYNQYDALGVPFFDYRNTNLNTDKQINIYGHNTTNPKFYDQLPFVNLESYTDENVFNNYKDIYLDIDERQMKYEVIAIKIITKADNEHMKLVFYSNDDFIQHADKLLSNTLYKNQNLKITSSDRLLVLQVCHYDPVDTYLLVIAKEVDR